MIYLLKQFLIPKTDLFCQFVAYAELMWMPEFSQSMVAPMRS